VVVAAVPWARHGSGFTKGFEETVAWLATRCSKTAVSALMRVAWLTVGRIIARVAAEAGPLAERLRGVKRLGIDEVSYRKGQRYLTVVVDHDSGLLLWAAPGNDRKTLHAFFDLLGPEGCAAIEAVTADAAAWIRQVVEVRCPQAAQCMDPFHVVQWATDALDVVRRDVWNDARRSGQQATADQLKGCRFALWKNPEDLTERQEARLAHIERTNRPLYRAYLLKEQLRQVFRLELDPAKELLKTWVKWARRSRLKPFVTLAKRINEHLPRIVSAIALRLSNGLVESVNTKIRLITRQAFGFHSAEPLIGLALLALGGLCPPLPGRAS
jgi:transposase